MTVESQQEFLRRASEGACRRVPSPLWLTDDLTLHRPPATISLVCARCPLEKLCLEFALEVEQPDGEAGIWGGTTPYQRQQLKRDRSRVHCPSCGANAVVAQGRGEVCLECGISWII